MKHQIANSETTDTEKLVLLSTYLRKEFGFIIHREPILTFDLINGSCKGPYISITSEQYYASKVHVPDILFYNGNQMWVFEIDGPIHDTNNTVQQRDVVRAADYERAGIKYKVFNEWEILLSQGIRAQRSAKAWELRDNIFKYVKKHVLV